MKAYLANGLFSQADFLYNHFLATQLRDNFPDLRLYLPQENLEINDKTQYANSIQISRGDDDKLLDADFLIAVIDGNGDIDSGVACEIGKFAGFDINFLLRTGTRTRPIFALYTDSRQQGRDNYTKVDALIRDSVENQFPYRNLYVIGTIKDSGGAVYDNVDALIQGIKTHINRIKEG